MYSRVWFIRHPKGQKKSDEYSGVTNKPNTNIIHLNGRAISRDLKMRRICRWTNKPTTNKPDSSVYKKTWLDLFTRVVMSNSNNIALMCFVNRVNKQDDKKNKVKGKDKEKRKVKRFKIIKN